MPILFTASNVVTGIVRGSMDSLKGVTGLQRVHNTFPGYAEFKEAVPESDNLEIELLAQACDSAFFELVPVEKSQLPSHRLAVFVSEQRVTIYVWDNMPSVVPPVGLIGLQFELVERTMVRIPTSNFADVIALATAVAHGLTVSCNVYYQRLVAEAMLNEPLH